MAFGVIKHLIGLDRAEHLKRTAVTLFILSFFCGHIIPSVFLVLLILTPLYPIVVLYLAWVLVFDWKSPKSGFFWPWVRRSDFVRRARLFQYFRDFFPVNLVKTAELDPKKNYIFAYHPHGVFAVGCFSNFATEATGFSRTFPGLTIWCMTFPLVFAAPLVREFLMLLGVRSVCESGCRHALSLGAGHSIAIVPGGTKDMLEARPGAAKIAIRKRKGFVRIALESGAQLVPVYSFGENELYDQPKSSFLRKMQRWCTYRFGMSYPFFQGEELCRMLPYRHPIFTIVGSPLGNPHIESPTPEEVDYWHRRYLEDLSDLFDKHKQKYGVDPNTKLEFI